MKFVGCTSARLICLIFVAILAQESAADLTISVGNQELLPYQANQPISFYVTTNAGDMVGGMSFRVQVGDGGSYLGGSDTTGTVPSITSIDLLTGTIFAAGNQSGTDTSDPLFGVANADVSTNVLASGKIATVVFSTIGLGPGAPVPLRVEIPSEGAQTTFVPTVGASLIAGTISVVPEPSSFLYVGLVCVGGFLVRFHRALTQRCLAILAS